VCCLSVRNHHWPATARTNSGTPAAEIQIIKESMVEFIPAQPFSQCVTATSISCIGGSEFNL